MSLTFARDVPNPISQFGHRGLFKIVYDPCWIIKVAGNDDDAEIATATCLQGAALTSKEQSLAGWTLLNQLPPRRGQWHETIYR